LPTEDDICDEIDRLKWENHQLSRKGEPIRIGISKNGLVYVSGIRVGWPLGLHAYQWLIILDNKEKILRFIDEENAWAKGERPREVEEIPVRQTVPGFGTVVQSMPIAKRPIGRPRKQAT